MMLSCVRWGCVLFLAIGQVTAMCAEAVKVVAAPGGGKPADAETGSNGDIHLVCDASDGPYYVRSSDAGASFTPPMKVVQGAKGPANLEFSVFDMAVGKDGQVLVALLSNAWKLKLPKDQWGFYLAILEPGAKSFAALRNINGVSSEGFSIASDEKGTIVAYWLAGKLFGSVSRDGGKTFSAGGELNPAFNPCDCCTTRAAIGSNGTAACLYREETGNQRDIYLVLQSKDGRTSRERVSTTAWETNTCPMTYYSVSAAKSGFVAAWPTKGDIYFARLSAEGKVLPPGEVKTPGKSGMRTGVLALAAPDGHVMVAWNTGNNIGWQVYDEKGAALGETGTSLSSGKNVAGVVDKSGQFILFR